MFVSFTRDTYILNHCDFLQFSNLENQFCGYNFFSNLVFSEILILTSLSERVNLNQQRISMDQKLPILIISLNCFDGHLRIVR